MLQSSNRYSPLDHQDRSAVLLTEPQRTQYDVQFNLFGFPVRIHPMFWLFSLLFSMGDGTDGTRMVVVFSVAAVSLLLHELGHAFMIRRMGRRARIVLYAMGGLAIEGSDDPYAVAEGRSRRTPLEQILISAAGPGIQLALALLVWGATLSAGGEIHVGWANKAQPFFIASLPSHNQNLELLVSALLYINIFWAAINLLPVFPLDGGQIAQQLLTLQDPWTGMTRALWLSVIVGGGMAVIGFVVMNEMFIGLLFASLAYSSYHALKQMQGGGGDRPW